MTNPFVFIVGCPRSGTTLLLRMVDAHPQIAIIPEIGWISRRYENRDGLTPDGLVTPAFIHDLLEKGGLGRYTRLPMSRQELEDLLASGRPLSYAKLITLLFDRYGEARGKALVGNKTVEYVLSIPTLHSLWPRAKFVHLIRDGRDVCLSAINWRKAGKLVSRFATWSEDPVSAAALWWEWHVRLGREAGCSLSHQKMGTTSGDELYYEIRYESLVARPMEECVALCAFLGVPYDGAMLRFHRGRMRMAPDLDAKHAWLPPTPGLRDWRSQMSPEDVQRFEAVAGDLLDELGYPRGADQLRAESLEHAATIRRLFEGRPLPERWRIHAQ